MAAWLFTNESEVKAQYLPTMEEVEYKVIWREEWGIQSIEPMYRSQKRYMILTINHVYTSCIECGMYKKGTVWKSKMLTILQMSTSFTGSLGGFR